MLDDLDQYNYGRFRKLTTGWRDESMDKGAHC